MHLGEIQNLNYQIESKLKGNNIDIILKSESSEFDRVKEEFIACGMVENKW